MKKSIKAAIKLLEFLIRTLTKILKAGTKTLENLKSAAETGGKIAPILVEISSILITLQQKKIELEKLAEEK